MAVGEISLSSFIQVLFQQLTSGAIVALARREKVENHFKKLSLNLSMIQDVLDDAEKKQLTEKSIGVWLARLRDLAFDLDDILDEISTQALIQESEGIQHNKASGVCKFIPTCSSYTPEALIQESEGIQHNKASGVCKFIPTCSSYTPGALASNQRMMSKIKAINDRLQFLVKARTELKFRDYLGGLSIQSSMIRLPTTSLVIESNVFGRDEDKEAIIQMLLGNEARRENVSVIPIVGMGGIGKTTLTQLVYNDRNVTQNFQSRAWVCVSEEFDVISITKTIYQQMTGMNGQSLDPGVLQLRLKEKLSENKFLIVLDDVWNENYEKWDHLFRPFQFGLPGSRIIITTRNDSVASVMGSPWTAYRMKLLTDKDCLSILARYAGRSLDENLELREIGLGLAKKCKGLPLAAEMLGGFVHSNHYIQEGGDILNINLCDLPEEYDILPDLRLSYGLLPSHLKQLFAYCSIFPKGYEFDKNELVLLWMGEGFLERPSGRKSMEEYGAECFSELLSRSFFQRLSGSDSKFVMHDFINDLAHSVAGGTCYRLDEKTYANREYQLPNA